MYVILVYDINLKRLVKVLKICRKYLNRVQNSVFEGEITEAKLVKLKSELNKKIKKGEDSVIIYKLKNVNQQEKEVLSIEKVKIEQII